jgi:HK97 family phage portal protein
VKWWKGALGLELDGPTDSPVEGRKSVIDLSDQMAEWAGVSRQDGTNFRTNMVTVAEYQDSAGTAGVLNLSAAWACVNLLAGTIASLPLMVYRTDKEGRRTVAADHSLYRVLHDSPNADQTALDFWEFVCACLEMQGNSYCEVERGSDGRVIALSPPLAPELVSVRRAGNGDLEYRWTQGRTQRRETQQRILHIRGFGGSPLGGLSTLSFGRQAFGLAKSINTAARATFANGVRPSGVMTLDKALTKEQRNDAEALLQEKYQGTMNAGVPMLLDNGLKWQTITINPEDAQMLESRAFSVEEICRFFGVPPHMVGHTDKSTSWGTGLEQQTLAFQKFTLRRRLKRIEMALEKQLLTPRDRADGITIEFNLEGLLRADSKSRAEFYNAGLQNGWFTINEVRGLENMPPVEGGDVPRMQMQNVPISGTSDGEQFVEGVPAVTDVQATALNGAQVTALQTIVQSVADGLMPAQSAIEMLTTAFPSLTAEEARRIIGPATNFKPAPRPVAQPNAGTA